MAHFNTKASRSSTLALGLAALVLTACDQPEPVTYRIPKEERSTSTDPVPGAPANAPSAPGGGTSGSGMQVLPGMAEAAEAAGDFDYSIPEGWEEFPASGIRKANFRIEDGAAEVTVLVFPGDVGGTLANINRWRQQIGLEPTDQAELPKFTERYPISNHGGLFVRMIGPEQAILGGLLPFHGNTWFFKMQGDIATVSVQEAAMKQFLDSVAIEDTHH